MKKIIVFISCLFCFEISNGQAPTFEWAKDIGNGGFKLGVNSGKSVAMDASGNVYTTGYFNGTIDFDPGLGVFNLTATSEDGFVLKLDPAGNFLWAKQMLGTMDGRGNSLLIDVLDNVYITGYFTGIVDFDPGVGINSIASAGSYDMFILKLDSSGNFIWAKNIGGAYSDGAYTIALDILGNVYTSGFFSNTVDFDPGIGIFNLTAFSSSPYNDIFISKLDSSGNFIWAKNIGGTLSGIGIGYSIDVDISGSVYTTGFFKGTADFNPGVGIFNLVSTGGDDIFISKLDTYGNFLWAKKMGGVSGDIAYSIAFDSFGNIYTTGNFNGTADFDPNAGIYNLISSGSYNNAFISKLDSLGNFVWAKSIGGTSFNFGTSISLDALDNIYATGYFQGTTDFDPSAGIVNLTSVGGYDIYVLKLNATGSHLWAFKMGSNINDYGVSITQDALSNIYTVGGFQGVADFDPGVGTFSLSSTANDIFIQKMSQGNLTTTINEATYLNNISIYPNPNNGIFNISISSQINKGIIAVYNSIGALVYLQEITNQENSIELSNQANGLYFVKVMSDNKIVGTRKIIKE